MAETRNTIGNNDITKVNDTNTTVLVYNYLIQYFNSKSVDIKNKNNKFIELLLNNDMSAKDSALGKFKLNLYTTENVKKQLKNKQIELGYTNFTQFANATLQSFYEQNHVIREKVVNKTHSAKPKINLIKFQRLMKKCKKNLIDGEYTSYDKNVRRCLLSKVELQQKVDKYKERVKEDYTTHNCYSELGMAIQWDVTCDCLESYILNYIRKYELNVNSKGYIEDYQKLIGLNNNNFKERELEFIKEYNISSSTVMTIDGEEIIPPEIYYEIDEYITKKYDFEIPDINTYFYLWIYFMYREHKIYSNVNLLFSTDDEYAEKLLEKYTVNNIFEYYLKSNKELLIKDIFDDNTIEYLNGNKLFDLHNLYQNR